MTGIFPSPLLSPLFLPSHQVVGYPSKQVIHVPLSSLSLPLNLLKLWPLCRHSHCPFPQFLLPQLKASTLGGSDLVFAQREEGELCPFAPLPSLQPQSLSPRPHLLSFPHSLCACVTSFLPFPARFNSPLLEISILSSLIRDLPIHIKASPSLFLSEATTRVVPSSCFSNPFPGPEPPG